MQQTPKGNRLHISFFGRRNVGKSSLLNAITRQAVSIVSEAAGTTTDPVEKPMEILPIGPVLFIDTAGIDDEGALGEKRVEKTKQVFDRTDVGVIVTQKGEWGDFEELLFGALKERRVPIVVVFNKADLVRPGVELLQRLTHAEALPVETVSLEGEKRRGILDLREALIRVTPEGFLNEPPLAGDLVSPGEMVVLVVPVDMEAPRGRLILPQVQTIRDLMDHRACCLMVQDRGLRDALSRLKGPPALVVTDSQAFGQVAADTPREVKMTSFSILFARYKGDLCELVRGALTIEALRPGDRILICEACTHHPIGDDIGRVKIPRFLERYVGGALEFTHYQGYDFPADLSPYRLVIHCGACMHNRRSMLMRISNCKCNGVPITNYGLAIAYSLGIFARALEPFPDALGLCQVKRRPRAFNPAAARP